MIFQVYLSRQQDLEADKKLETMNGFTNETRRNASPPFSLDYSEPGYHATQIA
jgi:hypothetical protein